MAAKSTKPCLKEVMVVLRLLANTELKSCEKSSSDTKGKNSFDELLEKNLSLIGEALANDAALQGLVGIQKYLTGDFRKKASDMVDDSPPNVVRRERENVGSLKPRESASCVDVVPVRWTFVQVCLQTLRILRDTLRCSNNERDTKKGTPMDLLSVSDQKLVSTIIQLVVVLGICRNLLPGVGIPIEQRSGFSHIFGENAEQAPSRCPKCLYKCTTTLVKCLDEPSLSMIILSRHFIDILSALLQLAYSHEMFLHNDETEKSSSQCEGVPNGKKTEFTNLGNIQNPNDNLGASGGYEGASWDDCGLISQLERKECAKTLMNIIDKMYQPLVVRELLFLQGSMASPKSSTRGTSKQTCSKKFQGKISHVTIEKKSRMKTPQWMKEVCGHLLSKCLMKKNGVQNVLRGILEGASGISIEWKVCEAIAQLIANCPLQAQSPDDYYKCISPQVLDLLHLPNAKLRQQYSRVSIQIIHAMMRRYPDLATKYIANPLMKPFLLASGQSDISARCTVLVNEIELSHCIESLHKVYVASPDSDQLVLRNIERIISPMFELFCFTRHGVSHVRTAVLELLSTFLKRSNEHDCLLMLYVLAFNELPSSNSKEDFLISQNISTAEIPIQQCTPKIYLMVSHCAFEYGEGGGVILVRKDRSGKEVDPKPRILGDVLGSRTDVSETRALCLVEILESLRKNDDVPGNFFLYLLQQVQEIILNPNFGEIQKIRALTIFHVLALMCEKLGPSVLKNTHQMITFIEVTLSRAHQVYMETSCQENETGGFELETITMALGMLWALLSGAVKVERSDFIKLQGLTSLLREIADKHVEEEITELANDLLVLILTRGAVWSEKSKESGEKSKRAVGSEVSSQDNTTGEKSSNAPHENESAKVQSADFDVAFEQLCDPLLPARGHALMRLATLLRNRDPKALGKIDVLVKTFQDSLIHDDSYIYLAAIEGLVAAADVKTVDVLPYLLREYVKCHGKEGKNSLSEQEVNEGMYTSKKKGDNHGSTVTKRSATTRMKLGEALLRATKMCGEMTPYYFESLIRAFLVGVKDEESYIRASSLSNLGEVCRLSPHTLPSVIHEIFHCVSSVLKCDKASEVRQAAVLVITLVFRGLGKNSIKVLAGILKDFYQLLKLVQSADSDNTTRVHAQVALAELESIMREQLFPQQRLVKHINVLP